MAKFFAGQRVRVKYCINSHIYRDLTGKEGMIVGPIGTDRGPGWEVQVEGEPEVRWDGTVHAFLSDQLEPSTDANDKIEWSECLWCPEHLRETA